MTTDPRSSDAINDVPDLTFSRRGFGKRLLLGASAFAVLLAGSKADTAQAAATTPWVLGGNTILTNGTEFLGTKNVAPLIFKTAATANIPLERMRITDTGNVGIGMTNPSAKLQVYSTTYAVYARHTATTGNQPAVQGETAATDVNASGVLGKVMSTAPGANSAGVLGQNNSTSGNGTGVRGKHAGYGYGVHGTSVSGYGLYGDAGFCGAWGKGNSYGVIGTSPSGYGIYGSSSTTAVYGSGGVNGVQGHGSSIGVHGSSTGVDPTDAGVYGSGHTGVYGTGHTGVYGQSSSDSGVSGSGGRYGVRGINGSTAGVRGDSGYVGVWGEGDDWGFFGVATKTTGQNYGIMAESRSPQGYAGWFKGRVHIEGTLSKGGGSFKIDHPLDPDNRYLYHSFVESPDMMNVYNGNVTTDARGEATVELPAYFEALNRDFRYQLTVLGQFAQAIVADKITNNRFTIKTDKPDVEVSWQVTGIRQDAFANANRIPVEEDKAAEDRGKFLYPEALGKPATQGITRSRAPEAPQANSPAPQPPEPPSRAQPTPPRAPGEG